MINVLLVEDEKWSLRDLEEVVNWEKHHFKVSTADSAELAFEMVKSNNFQCVITDIKMVNMSGLDLLKQIKIFDSEIDVIILSAYDDFDFSREAFLNGAMDYLLKPVNKEHLERLLFAIQEKHSEKFENSEDTDQTDILRIPIISVINNIKADITGDIKTKLTLKELANKYFVTESYISREFRRYTGQTITQFTLQTRLKKACELLENTDLSIYEVATNIGYDDYCHFSKIFKREIGVSPAAYRKYIEKQIADTFIYRK